MLLDARKNMSFYNETPFVFEYSDNIVIVNDGDVLEMESGKLVTAVFTPGHNPSCITWVMGDAIFTGDSYIPGAKTVTNLPDGNRQLAEASILMIKQLSMGRTIYPGHKV